MTLQNTDLLNGKMTTKWTLCESDMGHDAIYYLAFRYYSSNKDRDDTLNACLSTLPQNLFAKEPSEYLVIPPASIWLSMELHVLQCWLGDSFPDTCCGLQAFFLLKHGFPFCECTHIWDVGVGLEIGLCEADWLGWGFQLLLNSTACRIRYWAWFSDVSALQLLKVGLYAANMTF